MITDGLRHWTALLFLGAALAGVALVAAYVFARLTTRPRLAHLTMLVGGVGAAAYLGTMLVVGLASDDRVLPPSARKHICELDCHLAYSVESVRREAQLDGGTRYVVTVRVLFDAETTAPWRPVGRTLAPNSRYVALVDAYGRHHRGSTDGLRRRLLPGESYTTDIAFDVPGDAQPDRLVLRSADLPTSFIIGHENSLFHGATEFALPSSS